MTENRASAARARKDHAFFAEMTIKQRQAWAKAIVARLKQALAVKTQKALAQVIGCHGKDPTLWIKRGRVPDRIIYWVHHQTDTPLDWLYNGKLQSIEHSRQLEDQVSQIVTRWIERGISMEYIQASTTEGTDEIANKINRDIIAFFTHKK